MDHSNSSSSNNISTTTLPPTDQAPSEQQRRRRRRLQTPIRLHRKRVDHMPRRQSFSRHMRLLHLSLLSATYLFLLIHNNDNNHSLAEAWAPPRRIRAIWNRQLALKPIPPVSWNSNSPVVSTSHGYLDSGVVGTSTRLSVLAERPTDISNGKGSSGNGGNGFDKNNRKNRGNRRKQQQQNNKNRRRRRAWDQDDDEASTAASAAASALDAEVASVTLDDDLAAAAAASAAAGVADQQMSRVADRAEREYELIREEENLKLFFERHEPLRSSTESPLIRSMDDQAIKDLSNVNGSTSSSPSSSSSSQSTGNQNIDKQLRNGRQSNKSNGKNRQQTNDRSSSSSSATNGSQSSENLTSQNILGSSSNQSNNGNGNGNSNNNSNGNDDRNKEESQGFKIPQIHLPTRLVSRIGWEHHRKATTNFISQHFGKDDEQCDKNGDQINGSRTNGASSNSRDDDYDDPEIFHVAVDASVSDDIPTFIASHKKKNPMLVSSTNEWKRLEAHAHSEINRIHLRDLLQDTERCDTMFAEHDGVYLDYSRQRATLKTMELLQDLANKQKLHERIRDMMTGEKINFTEKRAVLHTALRTDRDHEPIMVDGVNVVEEIHEVLDQIKAFTDGVRAGTIRGHTGKRLRNIISVGIGGSYLGPEFLHEVLKTEPEGVHSALGYTLRFLANVDPVDVERTCADLDPEETLVIVVSKTFTTAETMLNARIMRQWLWDFMGEDPDVVRKHVVACASVSASQHVRDFGIDTEGYFFRFWDWVGGRYSVCSAAGAVPISLLYGFDVFEKFLKGANSIDKHFATAPLDRNIPVIMGLLGVWNMSFMKYKTRTTLPYAEALLKLPAHIQQLDMESNGKVMTRHGVEADYPVGEIDFGEPGTNGQHSFFQLLHMGQTCPCDFIGFCQSQHDLCLDDEHLSSHDELMANFFAQPDALAYGKTADQVRAEGVEEELVPHRTFKGNRPSMSLLLPKLTAYATGQLLAIYEHRTTVQGFIWDINSFDQWGVELGKKLAIDVKNHLLKARQLDAESQLNNPIDAGNAASSRILNYYVSNSQDGGCPEANKDSVNPLTRVTRKTHTDHIRTSDENEQGLELSDDDSMLNGHRP